MNVKEYNKCQWMSMNSLDYGAKLFKETKESIMKWNENVYIYKIYIYIWISQILKDLAYLFDRNFNARLEPPKYTGGQLIKLI